jgi:hypothetical protein
MLEGLVLAVQKEKLNAGIQEALFWQFGKKKLDAGKWVLTVQKEKTRYWEARYWQFRKKKLDAGKWVLTVQKEKTRYWEARYWQFRKKK